MLLKCAARAAMYHDMYNVLVLYTIHKKNTVLHQKNNPTKTLQSLNRDFMRAFLKLWMIVTIIRHTHIVAKLNIRFDMTARKKARSKKKWKTFMREKNPERTIRVTSNELLCRKKNSVELLILFVTTYYYY